MNQYVCESTGNQTDKQTIFGWSSKSKTMNWFTCQYLKIKSKKQVFTQCTKTGIPSWSRARCIAVITGNLPN